MGRNFVLCEVGRICGGEKRIRGERLCLSPRKMMLLADIEDFHYSMFNHQWLASYCLKAAFKLLQALSNRSAAFFKLFSC